MKTIKGSNCSLDRFKSTDEKLVEVIYKIFNEKGTEEFLNPDYMNYRTKPKIRKWIKSKSEHPVEVWYVIKTKGKYIGYICYKWRTHYDEACEISTAIVKDFRGLKLGFESSGLLVDHILSLDKFKYVVGYVHTKNIKAQNNIQKLGFRRSNRLRKKVTMQFYNDDGTSETGRRYVMYVIYGKMKNPK